MEKTKHILYEPSDFTEEEAERRNLIYINVVEGGLGICKCCGAAEQDLLDFDNCEDYRAWSRRNNIYEKNKLIHEQRLKNNLEELDLMLQLLNDTNPHNEDVYSRCINKLETSRASVIDQQERLSKQPAQLPRDKSE